jgi:outer membrane protein OmpA-like peptidoglycan-associated protein
VKLQSALLGLCICAVSSATSAQEVKTADQLVSELGTLLVKKRFSAAYRPDAVTGRCSGVEQGTSLGRKDLAVVPVSGENPVRAKVPFSFELDKHVLTSQDVRQADELAKALNDPRLMGRRFSISGHTDASGPVEHNRRLSCARALSVRDALVARNVDPRRLGVFGFGSEKLEDPANPKSGVNRRVVVENVDDLPRAP